MGAIVSDVRRAQTTPKGETKIMEKVIFLKSHDYSKQHTNQGPMIDKKGMLDSREIAK